jgi:hypothetical protein
MAKKRIEHFQETEKTSMKGKIGGVTAQPD